MQSLIGLTAEKSMRMKGKIAETEVVVLIDSGATSNFISAKLARLINLPVTDTRGFGVSVGNGQVKENVQECCWIYKGWKVLRNSSCLIWELQM